MKAILTLCAITSALLLGGCKESQKTADGSSTAASQTSQASPTTAATRAVDEGAGQACEEYVAALEACVKQMPTEARPPMQEQLDKQREALKKASPAEKQAMDSGCRTGLATLKQNPACQR